MSHLKNNKFISLFFFLSIPLLLSPNALSSDFIGYWESDEIPIVLVIDDEHNIYIVEKAGIEAKGYAPGFIFNRKSSPYLVGFDPNRGVLSGELFQNRLIVKKDRTIRILRRSESDASSLYSGEWLSSDLPNGNDGISLRVSEDLSAKCSTSYEKNIDCGLRVIDKYKVLIYQRPAIKIYFENSSSEITFEYKERSLILKKRDSL